MRRSLEIVAKPIIVTLVVTTVLAVLFKLYIPLTDAATIGTLATLASIAMALLQWRQEQVQETDARRQQELFERLNLCNRAIERLEDLFDAKTAELEKQLSTHDSLAVHDSDRLDEIERRGLNNSLSVEYLKNGLEFEQRLTRLETLSTNGDLE